MSKYLGYISVWGNFLCHGVHSCWAVRGN